MNIEKVNCKNISEFVNKISKLLSENNKFVGSHFRKKRKDVKVRNIQTIFALFQKIINTKFGNLKYGLIIYPVKIY